jgi:natural product precursor
MNALKLNQLNKQKVAEREMKDIEGGIDNVGYKCFFKNRAYEEYYSVDACKEGYNNFNTAYYYV